MSHFTAADWAAILAHEDTALDGPATQADLNEFERLTGLSLPESHKEFLRRGNGGDLGWVRLFGVNRADSLDLYRQIEESQPLLEETWKGPILPFAKDCGGSYFCFDLREPGREYPVLHWNHEYTEESELRPEIWSHFADDFVVFVRQAVA
jgi:hypothetical protein